MDSTDEWQAPPPTLATPCPKVVRLLLHVDSRDVAHLRRVDERLDDFVGVDLVGLADHPQREDHVALLERVRIRHNL